MTSSSSSLCRRHTDLHSPVSYAPSSLSAFIQSPTSTDYRRHSYQTDYLPQRVTSASSGLHGDAMMQHLQQQQLLQRSPSFAIHELLGLHGPMLPAACHGMFDCSAGAGGGAGGGYGAAAVSRSNYQQTQFFPASYHASSAPPPPSTPLSMPDLDPLPAPPPPPPLASCHGAPSSSWPPSTSPTSHVPQLTTAHAHRPATYRDAYDVLQRNFKPDVTRAFGAARSVSHKYVTHHGTWLIYVFVVVHV